MFYVKNVGDYKGLIFAIIVPLVFGIASATLYWLARKKNSLRLKQYAEGAIGFFTTYTFPVLFVNILTYYYGDFYFESAWYFLSIPFIFVIWWIYYKKVLKMCNKIIEKDLC